MQVVVAAPLSGGRARLIEALQEVALPGIAVAGAEPVAPGAGSVGAIVWFEWGPVLLDVTSWAALDARADDVRTVAAGGGLAIQPPSTVLVLEPRSAPNADAPDDPSAPEGSEQRARRTSALSPSHLRETLIDLARERYGQERWSTADVLWAMDLLHLPSAVNAVVDEDALVALGFPVSRVPLLDGGGAAPDDPDATVHLPTLPPPAAADEPVAVPAPVPVPAPAAADRSLLRAEQWDEPDDDQPRRVNVTLIAAILAVLVIAVSVVVFLNLGGGDDAQPGLSPGSSTSDPAGPGSSRPPASSSRPSATPSASPSASASPRPTLAAPAGYTVRIADAQTDCAAHAYGQVQQFFAATPCTQVQRQVVTGTADGRPILLSLREVTMPTAAGAASLRALVDTSGTGNVNDQLREGATYPGAPTSLPLTAYASAIAGARVRIVEGGFTDGGAADSPALQAAAAALAAAL